MAIDPSIALQYRPPQFESPINALGRVTALQGQMQQNQLQAMQAQDMHEQRADQMRQRIAMQHVLASMPALPDDAPPEPFAKAKDLHK